MANATPIFKDELTYLWAMMGDFISKEYSGTESVLTKAVLKGFMTTSDKIEQKYLSCKRYQKQTLTDDFKQMCIEILTGAHNKEDATEEFVGEYKHTAYKEMVQAAEKFTLQTISLNCHGSLPQNVNVILPLFQNKVMPEFIVVAL